jgi:hypothetical protein
MNAPRRPHTLLTVALAVVILESAMWGFGTKFFKFQRLVGDEEGSVTVVPILNYLLVSFGFLLVFVWALMHGMFRDIEKPKLTMLETEHRLDEEAKAH